MITAIRAINYLCDNNRAKKRQQILNHIIGKILGTTLYLCISWIGKFWGIILCICILVGQVIFLFKQRKCLPNYFYRVASSNCIIAKLDKSFQNICCGLELRNNNNLTLIQNYAHQCILGCSIFIRNYVETLKFTNSFQLSSFCVVDGCTTLRTLERHLCKRSKTFPNNKVNIKLVNLKY